MAWLMGNRDPDAFERPTNTSSSGRIGPRQRSGAGSTSARDATSSRCSVKPSSPALTAPSVEIVATGDVSFVPGSALHEVAANASEHSPPLRPWSSTPESTTCIQEPEPVPYVITEACIGTKDHPCADACPSIPALPKPTSLSR